MKKMKRPRWKIQQKALVLGLLLCAALFGGCGGQYENRQDVLKEAAITNLANGSYEEALSNINEALTLSGGRVSAREIDLCYYKGAAQYLLSDAAGAIDTYANVIAYDAADSKAYFLRGSLYLKEKETELALADYRRAVETSGQDYELYIQIYENLNSQDFREEGLDFLNLALEIEGDGANNLFWRGRIYLILGQEDAAIKVLSSAAQLGKEEANIYLAKAYRMADDEESANAILNEYANSENVSPGSYQAMGELMFEQGDYIGALNAIDGGLAVEDAPNRKQLMKNRIGVLEYMGNFPEALNAADAFIAEYPADEDVLNEIIFLKSRV